MPPLCGWAAATMRFPERLFRYRDESSNPCCVCGEKFLSLRISRGRGRRGEGELVSEIDIIRIDIEFNSF